jgi:hypothetical protein
MQIKIKFHRECRLGIPHVRCIIDEGAPFFDGPCEDVVSADIHITPGFHELVIGHYNKQDQDHVLDSQGRIIIDKHVEILGIEIDGIELRIEELREAHFYPLYNQYYVQDCKNNGITLPPSISPNLYLGHNGTWKFPFHTPFLDWIIHRRKNLSIQLDNTIFQSDVELLAESKAWFQSQPEIIWPT